MDIVLPEQILDVVLPENFLDIVLPEKISDIVLPENFFDIFLSEKISDIVHPLIIFFWKSNFRRSLASFIWVSDFGKWGRKISKNPQENL